MTDRDSQDSWATDVSALGADGSTDSVPHDFEHHRIFASVRKRLFGKGEDAYIDRFRVERRLGAGGMGEVYLCADERLRRQVAVKLVLGMGSAREHARLRREAQAQARLSHTNVVHVYEIGEHRGRTFVAMQYVEGQTLTQWLETTRPRDELLACFVAAGRGLAAAHHKGIVHRDFKPDNVLIDGEGVVRVADFGLALVADDLRAPNAEAAALGPELALAMRRSVTGSVAGTIRYMPLEQLLGREVGPRSDQFAFCVALYEALWGEPPFSIASTRERIAALEVGRAKPPARSWGLWPVIRVGLRADPNERWPSMDALLDALERVPRRRTRSARVFFAGAAIVSLGLFGWLYSPADPCAAVASELDGVWDRDRAEALADRLGTLDAGVVARFDAWAAAWTRERKQLCRVNGSPTTVAPAWRPLDACLTRQRDHVARLVEQLLGADLATLTEAVVAVELSAPSSCADALLAVEPPPADIEARVEDVRREINQAHDLRLLGHFEDARIQAGLAVAHAKEVGYEPSIAEAVGELAKLEDEAGSVELAARLYEDASDLADIHHQDRLVAELWIERAELVLFDVDAGDRLEAGQDAVRRAKVAWRRAGGLDVATRARSSFLDGRVAELGEHRDAARLGYSKAIVLARVEAKANLQLSAYLRALARVVDSPERRLALLGAAVLVSEQRFGPHHPRVAGPLFEHGLALNEAKPGSGDRQLERAAAIWTAVYPQRSLLVLGREALVRGDLDRAEDHARALAELDPVGGESEQLLATIEGVRGNPEAALAHALVALDRFERVRAPGRDMRLRMRELAFNQLLALDRLDEAADQLDRIFAEVDSSDTKRVQRTHSSAAELALRRAKLDDADTHLRAIEKLGLDELDGSQTLIYTLLRALTDLRRGQLLPTQTEQLRAAWTSSRFNADQLASWLDELGLTAEERRRLEL